MAKQQNTNGNNESFYSLPDVYTTSKGEKIRLIGLNPTRLQKLQTAGKMPSVPVRLVPTAFGEDQKEELTADSLANDEEKKAWQEYSEKKEEVEAKRNDNVMKYVFFEGISVDDSKIEEWKEQEVYWGVEVSDNPIDRKIDFINAKVIGNAEDLSNIMVGVMERTGVPAEALDDVRNTFRGNLRRETTD